MKIIGFVTILSLLSGSSLNGQISPDDRRRVDGYEEYNYRFDGKNWTPIWLQCDAPDEVVLISQPDSVNRVRYETYKKKSPSQRTVAYFLRSGRAGSSYYTLAPFPSRSQTQMDKYWITAATSNKGGWLRNLGVVTNLNQCDCQWFPQTRFVGITERRSVYVTVSDSGKLEYRSFNFSEAQPWQWPTNQIKPSVLLQGGVDELDWEAGLEIFTFEKEEYTYVVEVGLPDRSPSAHIVVKKNNVEVQRERCHSFAYAWKAPISPIPHLAAGQPVDVKKLQMLDATTGWAVGQGKGNPNDHILHTADGGLTWRDVSPPESPASDPHEGKSATAFFMKANDAWVTYYFIDYFDSPEQVAVCWSTHDAGQTWTLGHPLPIGDNAEYYKPSDLSFVDSQTGWLMAHVGHEMGGRDYVEIFATTDGGLNWERVGNPYYGSSKTGMVFANTQTGLVTASATAVSGLYFDKTVDGGRTWQSQDLPPPPGEAPDLFTNEDNAWSMSAPMFLSAETGLVVVVCYYHHPEPKRWLYLTIDGGKTWRPRSLPTLYGSIDFISSTTGWSLGSNDRDTNAGLELYQTQDGGQTWMLIKKLGWSSGELDFFNEREGWAIARTRDAVALVKTIDGGKTWQELKPHIGP